jgi:GT2 family glycosyltransferase
MVKCSVVIPVFEQAALTAQCLEAVLQCGVSEVIVVDDASRDDTPAVLARFGSRVRVVAHAINQGFARSCNDGAAAASEDMVVFLNNDTVPRADAFGALVDYAKAHPEASVVGCKLLYPNDTIQHAGVVICQDRYPRHVYAGFPAEHPAVNQSRPFQIVTAACALIRRGAFELAGGFDTVYRNGFEDVDLCLRLGQEGHQVHYCANSVVHHLESMSPGRFRHDRENVARYRERWLHQVLPDDLNYYVADGLLRVQYEGRYPLHLEVSPLLATLDLSARHSALERQLQERSRQIAELTKENLRLSVEAGSQGEGSPARQYQKLRRGIRETICALVPKGAKILVLSKGDGALLELGEREGWHFPRTEQGAYAGHYPADSAEAIAHLEALRAQGAEYFVIPASAAWWLEHYAGFREHLKAHASLQPTPGDVCRIYHLNPPTT